MNIPNLISIFRVILVPVFVIVYFSDLQNANLWSAFVFLIAAISDIIDGILARKLNQITELGKVLDPLGDKLMVTSAFICLAMSDIFPLWLVVVLFIKELLLALGGFMLIGKNKPVFPSNYLGKFNTFLLCTGGIVFLLSNNIPKMYVTIYSVIAVILAVLTFLSYLNLYLTAKKGN